MKTSRVAFTLPSSMAADLSYVALRFGSTKSDLVAGLLAEPLKAMREILFSTPEPLSALSPEQKAALFEGYAGMVDAAVEEGQEVSRHLRGVSQ